jgi:ubiquinone/menaquinone biosynthesis C-methylase UbiE
MYGRLQKEAMRVGVNANLVAGTAENLPISDASVDAVISSLVLCTVVDQHRALGEVIRVLKPGGKFLFIEHVAAARGTWLRRTQRWLKPIWRQMADGCNPDRETFAAVEHANFRKCKMEKFTVPLPIMGPHIAGVAFKGWD